MLPVVPPAVLPDEPSALLPLLLEPRLLPLVLEPRLLPLLLRLLPLLRLPLLPAALDDDESLCLLPMPPVLLVLAPRLPEPCEPLCWLPALLVPPTEPLLDGVAGLALLGEALVLLPRLWPGVWLLPMLESRLASLPLPSVDF
jgi:hypothetical protein